MNAEQAASSDRRILPVGIIAVAGLAVLLRVGIALTTHFTQEDFLITLRYAENIASGRGFVFNAGERVLGTTTPLYALLLALFAKLGLLASTLGKAINILADGALCVVVYRWLSLLGQSAAGYWAAFFIAVNPVQIRVAISGQESSLAALCGALVWLWYTERRCFAAYLAGAALFLLRWDGLILIAVLTIAVIVRERRVPFREMLLFAGVCAPWLLFAVWYFGSPIPVTLAAKATVYGWYFPSQRFPQMHSLLYRLGGTPRYALMACTALIGIARIGGERRPSPLRSSLLPPVAWFVFYWLAFLVSKVLLFEWYLVPPLFVYEMLAALGLTTLGAAIAYRLSGSVPAARSKQWQYGAACILACCLGVINVRDAYKYTQALQQLEDHLRRPLGFWLQAHSQPGDRVMLEPIGYIGYYSRLPVIDMTGLVTPGVLPAYARTNRCPWFSIAEKYRPEWCVVRPWEAEAMKRAPALAGHTWQEDYGYVRSFTYDAQTGNGPTVFEIYHRKPPAAEKGRI